MFELSIKVKTVQDVIDVAEALNALQQEFDDEVVVELFANSRMILQFPTAFLRAKFDKLIGHKTYDWEDNV